MDRRAFLVVVALLSGCSGVFDDEDPETITDPEDVTIVWDTLIREQAGTDDERVSVWGVARNEGDREFGYLEVRATFFDGEDEEVDTVITNVEDVTEGREWPFEVEFPHFGERAAAVDRYELEVVTGL